MALRGTFVSKYFTCETNFLTSNSRPLVETGKWYNTLLNARLCLLCDKGLIGDEFRYILECSALERNQEKISKHEMLLKTNCLKVL